MDLFCYYFTIPQRRRPFKGVFLKSKSVKCWAKVTKGKSIRNGYVMVDKAEVSIPVSYSENINSGGVKLERCVFSKVPRGGQIPELISMKKIRVYSCIKYLCVLLLCRRGRILAGMEFQTGMTA